MRMGPVPLKIIADFMVFLLSKAEKRQNEPETLFAGLEFPGLAYDLCYPSSFYGDFNIF
jgi:hypothetical protein